MPSAVPSSPLSLPPFLLQQLPPHHSRLPILTDLTPPPAVRPAQHESTFHEGTSRMLFETLNHQPAPPPACFFFSIVGQSSTGPSQMGRDCTSASPAARSACCPQPADWSFTIGCFIPP